MPKGGIDTAIGHWAQLMEGLQESPKHFYEAVTAAVERREIPGCHLRRVWWREGGIFSPKRVYLRAKRAGYLIDICGAPFGNAFFCVFLALFPAAERLARDHRDDCLFLARSLFRRRFAPDPPDKLATELFFVASPATSAHSRCGAGRCSVGGWIPGIDLRCHPTDLLPAQGYVLPRRHSVDVLSSRTQSGW